MPKFKAKADAAEHQGRRRHQGPLGIVPLAGDAPRAGRGRLPASDAIDATHDSIAQASAIKLLRDRFAAYPEVRSFLAAYDEPHRTVQDKVAALLTPTRHHVISRAQHARVSGKGGGLHALGFGVLKARHAKGNLGAVKDDDGNQVYTFSITITVSMITGRRRRSRTTSTPGGT